MKNNIHRKCSENINIHFLEEKARVTKYKGLRLNRI